MGTAISGARGRRTQKRAVGTASRSIRATLRATLPELLVEHRPPCGGFPLEYPARDIVRGVVTVEPFRSVIAATLVVPLSGHGELRDTLDALAESIPVVSDPASLALYGGGGLAGFIVVRGLLGRIRGRSQGHVPTTEAKTSTSTTAGTVDPKVAFTLPSLLPVSRGIREVTHDEVHALELGAVVGFVVTWLYSMGRTDPAVGIVIAFVGGALGFKRYSSNAVKTVRLEPWYALLALLAGAGVGYVFFVGGVPL